MGRTYSALLVVVSFLFWCPSQARTQLHQQACHSAEKCAEPARALGPSNAMAYQLLQVIHLKQKNYPALLQDIDSYLQLDSTSPVTINARQLRQQVAAEMQSRSAGK
jgi:hypothetical protein